VVGAAVVSGVAAAAGSDSTVGPPQAATMIDSAAITVMVVM